MFFQYKLLKMSSGGSFSSTIESFQRLEDFSTYTSHIRCFGKSIIPPLLTAEKKDEIFHFRATAAKLEANNVKKKENSSISDQVKAVYRSVVEHLASRNSNDFGSYCELDQQENSALYATKGIEFQTSSTSDVTFANEMYISTCKIPSSDICSIIHKDVIVSPSVIPFSNDDHIVDTECTTSSTDQNEAHMALNNPECSLCQVGHHQDVSTQTTVPSGNAEQMHSVSEDEHDSITESTEFGSLPTVINAKYLIAQDTDNESNATCMSQSTDLEKYMDSSIEYSSPDDVNTHSQMSNQLSASIRSDDASSETLVNTESELTPCASAMAMFSYTDKVDFKMVDQMPYSATSNSTPVYDSQRAHSVDSYIKTTKSCAKSLSVRKSQSEPSYSESSKNSDIIKYLTTPNSSDSVMKDGSVHVSQRSSMVDSFVKVLKTHAKHLPIRKSKSESSILESRGSDINTYLPIRNSRAAFDDSFIKMLKSYAKNSFIIKSKSESCVSELEYSDVLNTELNLPNSSDNAIVDQVFNTIDDVVESYKNSMINAYNIAIKNQELNSMINIVDPQKERASNPPDRTMEDQILNSNDNAVGFQQRNMSNPSLIAIKNQVPITKDIVGNSEPENSLVSESEARITVEYLAEVKKSLKRKHVRTNSYTLDHPSPALIMAHADCNCSDEPANLSPHSCCSEKIIPMSPNPAFKKEKVNIVLPPETQRDKYVPILSCTSILTYKIYSDKREDSEESVMDSTGEIEGQLQEVPVLDSFDCENTVKSIENSFANVDAKQVQNSTDNVNIESHELPNINGFSSSVQEVVQQNEQVALSSGNPYELKSNDIKELLNQVMSEVKEIQRNRVNQFFDEQNKLWFQMQEEFKEQERLLCEKLNAVDVSDGALSMPYEFNDSNTTNCLVIEKVLPETNANPHSTTNPNIEEVCLYVNTTDKESSVVNASESSYSPKSLSDTTISSNIKVTEFLHGTIVTSQPFTSTSNSEEVSSSPPKPPDRSSSLSILSSDCSWQTNSSDDFHSRSYSLQSRPHSLQSRSHGLQSRPHSLQSRPHSLPSSMSSKSLNNSDRQSANNMLGVLSDRPESMCSNASVRSETSTDDHFKACDVSAGSSVQKDIPLQSVSENGPKFSVPNSLESDCSSTSFRSSSDLTRNSSKASCDSRFLKQNNCPAGFPVNRAYGKGGSFCHYGPKCNCFEKEHISYGNLSDDGNRQFTTPISPAEFISTPTFCCQEQNSASIATNISPFQNPDHATTPLSLKSINSGSSDLNSSETTNPYAAEQNPSSNNNLQPNMQVIQNTLIINVKNNVSEINDEDKSYSEDEIRAINDLVQSSYTSSYSCKVNEGHCRALIVSDNLNKDQSRMRSCRSLHQIPVSALSLVEKGALKQSISTSLTNLKRRQSRDIIKDPVLLKKFEKLPAFVRGYLTRRLFKTERVQDLIRMLRDTALLVGKFSQELNLKGNAVNENDVDFHRQLIAQLLKTFESVYDIFCTMSTKEQMKIISESRLFRMKKKATGKKESAAALVTEKCGSSPSKKPKLSAATLKSLDRKRSSIDSRTYTVEDFKGSKPRVNSAASSASRTSSPSRIYKSTVAASSKSRNASPSRIYKSTAAASMKRKTTSVCKSSPWK